MEPAISPKQGELLYQSSLYRAILPKSSNKRAILPKSSSKKPDNCLVYETSFSKEINSKQQVESVHENQKPHKCPICDYRFSYKSILKIC